MNDHRDTTLFPKFSAKAEFTNPNNLDNTPANEVHKILQEPNNEHPDPLAKLLNAVQEAVKHLEMVGCRGFKK